MHADACAYAELSTIHVLIYVADKAAVHKNKVGLLEFVSSHFYVNLRCLFVGLHQVLQLSPSSESSVHSALPPSSSTSDSLP